MTTFNLAEMISVDGATYESGYIRATLTGGIAYYIFDFTLDVAATIEVDYIEAAGTTQSYVQIESSLGITQDDWDNSSWLPIGYRQSNITGSGTLTFEVGPGIEDWDDAHAAGENYLIFGHRYMKVTGIRVMVEGEGPIDFSELIPLYGSPAVTTSIVGPPTGAFYLNPVAFDPATEYTVDVEYTVTTGADGYFSITSCAGPTAPDADASNQYQLLEVTGLSGSGTLHETIGPGHAYWNEGVVSLGEVYSILTFFNDITVTSITIAPVDGGGGEEPPEPPVIPVYMLIDNPELEQAPDVLFVGVSGLTALAEVTFAIDGVDVDTEIADAGGSVIGYALTVDRSVDAGTHTVTATEGAHVAEADFTVASAPAPLPPTRGPDAPPVLVDDAVNRWVLQDRAPGGIGSWVMPINPTTMGNPHVRKTVAVAGTTVVHARPHVSEGASPVEWEFAGFAPDKAFQDKLLAYRDLRHRFYLIDHRNRAWIVAFADVALTPRKRHIDATSGTPTDWMADYTVQAVLYSQTPQEVTA